jgi:SET domain-containing protein
MKAGKKGLGLFTSQSIPRDTLIIEYVGMRVSASLLASAEFDKSYVVQSRDGMIDGSCHGNESRLINHSCNPNMVLQDWQVGGQSRVVFKSRLFIPHQSNSTRSSKP